MKKKILITMGCSLTEGLGCYDLNKIRPEEIVESNKRKYPLLNDEEYLYQRNLFHNNGVQNSGGTFNFSDNGRGTITAVQTDNAKMKTPTLRNIALTPPYMHNGQFNTLREVVDFYADSVHLSPTLDANMLHSGNIRLNLTNSERDDLIAFLETMTDTFVINNPKYRSPFK